MSSAGSEKNVALHPTPVLHSFYPNHSYTASMNSPLRNGGGAARIAVIPGDGIGKEVTPEAVKVLKAVTAPGKRPLEFVEFDWGADRYLKDGVTLPAGAVEMLRDEFDAILFGALGDPRVPSNQHAADILLGL